MKFRNFIKKKDSALVISDNLMDSIESTINEQAVYDIISSLKDDLKELTADHIIQLSDLLFSYKKYIILLENLKVKAINYFGKFPDELDELLQITVHKNRLRAVDKAIDICEKYSIKVKKQRVQTCIYITNILIFNLTDSLKNGKFTAKFKNDDNPLKVKYLEYANHTESVLSISTNHWFQIKNGCADNVLWLDIKLPEDLIEAKFDQNDVKKHFKTKETISEFVYKNILPALNNIIITYVGAKKEKEALILAGANLKSVLAKPVHIESVAGIFLDNKPPSMIAVIIDKYSKAVSKTIIKGIGEKSKEELINWLTDSKVNISGVCALPATGLTVTQNRLIDDLNNNWIQAEQIRYTALINQAKNLSDNIIEGELKEKSAYVIALRAQNPINAWSQVDLLSIGLGEYLHVVDQNSLHERLKTVLTICKISDFKEANAKPTAKSMISSINPLIKSINDLKSGMEVLGKVSNITNFGAFIDIGIKEQALVHISQLSDNHIVTPLDVVQIGDTVRARILDVDIKNSRISLTMKSKKGNKIQSPNLKRSKEREALNNLFKK